MPSQPDSATQTASEIQCTAFAPPAVKRGESFLVQLFAHLPDLASEANRMARDFDDAAAQRGFSNLSETVRLGQVLRFDIRVNGGTGDLEAAQLRWTGRTDSVQFLVTAGTAETLTALFVRVTISLDSVPIGQIVFKVAVAAQAAAAAPAEPLASSETFRRYFISYATKDRSEVVKRVQMLRLMGKEYRQDLFDLEPGVRFERKLYEFIRECDATLVFWSANAKASEWVMRECRYCIETKGIERLLPVIIEHPPPLPPPELAELHMNDKLLYFIVKP
ncbi:MAG: toll/interleukin-1 receptor domain-containing protein [Planctomycetota bacterium]